MLNILQQNMTLIADVFPELPALKNVIRKMSKKPSFTGPFDRWHDKWPETPLQSERQHLYNIC